MSLTLTVVKPLDITKLQPVGSPAFAKYGRILETEGIESIVTTSQTHLEIPAEGVVYEASLNFLETLPEIQKLGERVFGGAEVQTGWCIGKNRRLNALEYHKSSEVIIAITDLVLILGLVDDITEGSYQADNVEAFHVPQGTTLEILSEVLHFAPQQVHDSGFAALIMLPKGTNSPLPESLKARVKASQTEPCQDHELARLWMVNKWMICLPDTIPASRGARVAITGSNIELPQDLGRI